jgi:hypothetical protein
LIVLLITGLLDGGISLDAGPFLDPTAIVLVVLQLIVLYAVVGPLMRRLRCRRRREPAVEELGSIGASV